jgi:hypothetical protein
LELEDSGVAGGCVVSAADFGGCDDVSGGGDAFDLWGVSMRCLIVRKQWLDLILPCNKPGGLLGVKPWEMRSARTLVRGRIGLIEAGSGLVVGSAMLAECLEPIASVEVARASFDLHRVNDLALLRKWRFPWVLREVVRFEVPVPYDHPPGAVIWVKVPHLMGF